MPETILWIISMDKNIDLDGEIRGFYLLHVFGCHFKVADFEVDAKFSLEAVKLLLATSTVTAYGNQRRPTVLPRYEIQAISLRKHPRVIS
jgi:hypothetical protein